jgi:hypothetical protein
MKPKKNLIERAKANGSIQRLNMLISAAHILNCEANSLIEEATDLMAENGLMLGSLKRLHNNFVKAADLYFKDFASMVDDDGSKMDMFEDMDGFKQLFRKWSRLDQEWEPNN